MSRIEEEKCFLFLPVLIEHGMLETSTVFEQYNPSFVLQDQSSVRMHLHSLQKQRRIVSHCISADDVLQHHGQRW